MSPGMNPGNDRGKPSGRPTRTAVTLASAVALFGAVIFAARPAAAQGGALTIAVLPPSGSNVGPEVLEAAADVLKDHLQRTGRYSVISLGGVPTASEPTPMQVAAQAASVGAAQAIVLRITHLGSSARVRLSVYAAGSGQLVYWDSMPIYGGPEELDVVLQRLVHALVEGKPVRDAAEIDTVTVGEMQQLHKRQATKTFGLHLFSAFAFNAADGRDHAVPGAGLFWMYDARNWMADIAFDAGWNGGTNIYDVALGMYYPFSREDFSPYLGGSVKLAHTDFGGQGAGGLMIEPVFGVLLGRLSTVQVRAELGYFVDLFAETSNNVQAPVVVGQTSTVTSEAHVSHGMMLSVGLGI